MTTTPTTRPTDPVLQAGRVVPVATAEGDTTPAPGRLPVRAAPVGILGCYLVVTLLGLAVTAVHVTQGTAAVSLPELWDWATGRDQTDQTAAILIASRVPRLLAGLLVGVALGFSGTLLQSVARNPLASPDTLAVNGGAYLTVVLVGVLGVAVPFYGQVGLTFVGGLAAAALVLALARGGAAGPSRLILAGAAITLALGSLVTVLLILFDQASTGLFAWGAGSLTQSTHQTVTLAVPVLGAALLAALLMSRRMDLLALGDDAATVLGVAVRSTRVTAVLVAVLLAALAVTVAGPIGFVGLAAPLLARLLARRVPGLGRHVVLMPFAALTGVVITLGSDVLLRAVVPATMTARVPTGVVTSVLGAALLVWFARRLPDTGPGLDSGSAHLGRPRGRRTVAVVLGVTTLALLGSLVAALLLGDRLVLLGDVAHWLDGVAGREVTLEMGRRVPRVLAATLAGTALALAGTLVQAVCRNPLAEPGLLGVTAGAGLGAVTVLMLVPGVGVWTMSGAAFLGAAVVTALVFLLAYRRGLSSTRLVLIGVGLQTGIFALISLVILVTAPWDVNLAVTWMAGSTFGRTPDHLIPVSLALLVVTPLAVAVRRDLDVVALDEDTPRILGIALDRSRLLLLGAAAALTAAAVCAVGVVAFVGLVAPHAARALVGSRHSRVIPLAMILGALLVSVADTVGRSALAPIQIPAGIITALIGTPYFIYLLWRSRGADT